MTELTILFRTLALLRILCIVARRGALFPLTRFPGKYYLRRLEWERWVTTVMWPRLLKTRLFVEHLCMIGSLRVLSEVNAAGLLDAWCRGTTVGAGLDGAIGLIGIVGLGEVILVDGRWLKIAVGAGRVDAMGSIGVVDGVEIGIVVGVACVVGGTSMLCGAGTVAARVMVVPVIVMVVLMVVRVAVVGLPAMTAMDARVAVTTGLILVTALVLVLLVTLLVRFLTALSAAVTAMAVRTLKMAVGAGTTGPGVGTLSVELDTLDLDGVGAMGAVGVLGILERRVAGIVLILLRRMVRPAERSVALLILEELFELVERRGALDAHSRRLRARSLVELGARFSTWVRLVGATTPLIPSNFARRRGNGTSAG